MTKHITQKNLFNNKFGVFAIFNTPEKTKFAVLEVGMDKKGEIDYLTKLIKPDLGLITNVSYAHIENFSNLNQIAKAKGEIINNINCAGTMILNMDDKYFRYFNENQKKRGLKILTFSKKESTADVTFLNQVKYKNDYLFKIKLKGVLKTFIIPKELSSYKENILSSLSIIINF